ncbi:MAG TPA: GNAT family protein [Chthonomonadaceae bacterium]|nr:GNAT family protein [Chthonomonadaceae bacterium]
MLLTMERLLLREFVEDDWEAVLAYQSDPLYLRYNPWTQRSEAEVREFVGWFLANQKEQPRRKFQLAVVLKAEGRLIGNCGARINDLGLREGNIGYELDSRYWGQGYATEVAREIVRFGFEELGLHRIWSWCVAENVGSARVLEKVGMRPEGYLREKEYYRNRWWDHRLFAILDHEWKARQAVPVS